VSNSELQIGVCPNCGSSDRLTEPAVDAAGVQTGVLLVICAACGRHLGELPPLDPPEEVEDAERSLLLEEASAAAEESAGSEE